MFSIIVSGDLHFDDKEIRDAKKNNLNIIKNNIEKHKIELVISPGDLTEYGVDGGYKYFRKGVRSRDELTPLKTQWVKPLEDLNLILLLGVGNHDTYTGQPFYDKPVLKYVNKRHGGTLNTFNHNKSCCYTYEYKDILFISCGIYPRNLKWLKKNLKNQNMILFYHYNTIDDEPYSDWWSDDKKIKFYETIKPYKKYIKCIINGHYHKSYKKEWNDIPIINGSGIYPMLIKINENKEISEYIKLKN